MLKIADEDIGGAKVRRTFTMGPRRLFAGDTLSREEVLALPLSNRVALTDANYFDVWVKAPNAVLPDAERFIVRTGQGLYNVVAGHKLNDEPMTKEEAERLAKGD